MCHRLMQSCSHSRIVSYPHIGIHKHTLILSSAPSPTPSYIYTLLLSFFHALLFAYSHTPILGRNDGYGKRRDFSLKRTDVPEPGGVPREL